LASTSSLPNTCLEKKQLADQKTDSQRSEYVRFSFRKEQSAFHTSILKATKTETFFQDYRVSLDRTFFSCSSLSVNSAYMRQFESGKH
jgi:hypothetical protein